MNDFTRRIRLWILNDEGLYDFARGRAEEAWENSSGTLEERKDEAGRDLEESLKDFWTAQIDEKEDSIGITLHEMLTRAFDEVEWSVIAGEFIEEIMEDLPADEEKEDSDNE